MLMPSYTMNRDQLHRKLATISGGLPRRVKMHAAGQEAEVWDALFGAGDVMVFQWPRYDRIFDDREERDRCWFILEGSVDEWRGAIRAAIRGPGGLVGEMPMIEPLTDNRGDRFGAEVRTREPIRALEIKQDHLLKVLDEHPRLCRAMLGYVADHGSEYLNDHGQFDEALDQYFPGNMGWLLPAPYHVHKARMRIFFCRTSPEDHHKLALPPGLSFYLGLPLYMLVLIDMEDIHSVYPPDAERFSYNEVSVFVPVRVPGRVLPRFHVPHMYPDNIMAIYLGREIFGLPKLRSSNFSDCLEDGCQRFLMRRGDVNVLEAHYYEVPDKEAWRTLDFDPPQDVREALQRATGALADPFSGLLDKLADAVGEATKDAEGKLVQRLDGLLNLLPDWLSTIRTTSWKRIYDPHTRLVKPVPWEPDQFAVDGIVETPFLLHHILDFKLLRLVDNELHAPPGLFPTAPLDLVFPLGVEVTVEMTLDGGDQLIDYLGHHGALARENPERMVWAPDPADGRDID